ncbi:MAG TPA: hypothetical protein VLK35_09610 [Methylomirabilota bacterium]|nr:hypothetical protein [Methylomirabilota bacterium]
MRPALAAVVVVAAALALVALAACGDGGSPDAAGMTTTTSAAPQRLTAAEQALVARSERAVQRYCGKLALSLTGQGKPPSAEEQSRAFVATGRLIELASEKPAAPLDTGLEMGLFLGDLAEDLEGSNCDSRLVEQIDQALAALPQR